MLILMPRPTLILKPMLMPLVILILLPTLHLHCTTLHYSALCAAVTKVHYARQHMHTYIHTHTHTLTHTHTYIHIHIHIYIYIYTYTCIVYIYIHVYTHIYIYMHLHIYIYTHYTALHFITWQSITFHTYMSVALTVKSVKIFEGHSLSEGRNTFVSYFLLRAL